MVVQIEIPDEVFNSTHESISREVLEAVAVEGFRAHKLSTAQVRRLLGFETRFEVYDFLAKHGIPWVDYSIEDAERELDALNKLVRR